MLRCPCTGAVEPPPSLRELFVLGNPLQGCEWASQTTPTFLIPLSSLDATGELDPSFPYSGVRTTSLSVAVSSLSPFSH